MFQNAEEEDDAVRTLRSVQLLHGIPIFSLDYVAPADVRSAKEIEAKARDNGFMPYISEISLTSMPFFGP